MSGVLLNRKRAEVVHLGVWAYDNPPTTTRTGRHVPICGQDRGNKWEPHGGAYGWAEWTADLDDKPLCSRCYETLQQLQVFAESQP